LGSFVPHLGESHPPKPPRVSPKRGRWETSPLESPRPGDVGDASPWNTAYHRYRGKGKVHNVEVHYDSEDEEMHQNAGIDAYLEQSVEASDSCASEG
jgi:hypothetical protein